jgi:hypothetical protein
MDTYAQVLALLDTHYLSLEGWVRIVYSYQVVEYCRIAEVAYPVDAAALAEMMLVIDDWWMERMLNDNQTYSSLPTEC